MSIYTEHGYANRAEYLRQLAEEFEVPIDVVFTLADLLGKSEDFDGLVSALEDYADLESLGR